MANSFVRYTGDNSTTAYSIPFSYRATGDLTVTLAGSATTAFTLNAAGTTLTFSSPPASNVAIEIRRTTSQTTRLTDYASGSVLTENDLDTDSEQAFFMSQEAIDDADDVIKISNTDFQYDAGNKQIRNVANPTSNQDVATKHYLENTWLSTANKTALTTVNANIANINAVNSNSSNINSAVSNATNINTVATNIGSVNTVATDISKVIAVANDLAEAVSEVETVADDLNEATSEIDTVATNIANVNTVGTNIANVNTIAPISANITTVAGNNANVTTVAGISGNVTTVAGISANVTTVAGNNANITTVAGIDSDVTSVAGISSAVSAVNSNSSNINAVNSNSANINTVAGNNSNISTVAGVSSDVTTVAGISGDVTAVANISSDIQAVENKLTEVQAVASDLAEATSEIDTVAGSIANVDTVGTNISNVNTVAGNNSNITTVAGISSDVTSVAGISTAVSNVNSNSSNINAVNANSANINAVAGDATDIGTVASDIANVNTVAGISSNVTTVANDATDIGTVATNIANVNNVGGSITNVNNVGSNIAGVNAFAERYRVASTDPTSSLDAGDLAFNTTGNVFKYYDGSTWQQITAGGITDIAQDSTPQLGGNLDLNSNDITGTGNINITGSLTASGNLTSLGIDDNATSTAITINSSEQVAFTDGTASLPSITNIGDSDTGIFFPAADTIAFSEGGVEAMRINSSGILNTGKVIVRKDGASETEQLVILNQSVDSHADLHFKGYAYRDRARIRAVDNSSSATGGSMKIETSGGTSTDGSSLETRILLDKNGNISFYEDTGTTPKMFWDATNERLGVGTTSPSTVLDVRDETNGANFIVGGSGTTNITKIGGGAGDSLQLFTNSTTPVMLLSTSGNVGIGTSSPTPPSAYNGLVINATYPVLKLTSATSGTGASDGFTVRVNSADDAQLWHYENKNMSFATNDTERMRIRSNGKIGLGITSADAELHIAPISGGTNASILLSNSNSSQKFRIQNNETDDALVFNANDTNERMRIDSSGRVGIGETDNSTYTLGKKLVIGELGNNDGITLKSANTSNANYISFGDSDSGDSSFRGYIGYRHADNNLVFATGSTEKMRIDSSGKVSIGDTTSSGYRLKIKGTLANNADDQGILLEEAGTGGAFIKYDGSANLLKLGGYNAGEVDSINIVRNTGDVGIGNSAPVVKLHVGDTITGSAGSTGKTIISSQDFSTTYSGGAANTWSGLQLVNHDDTSNRTATGITFGHRSSSSGIAGIISTSNTADRADIRFITRGSGNTIAERVIINDNGNVGIGLSSPTQKLDVSGTVKATAFQGDGSALTGISSGVGTIEAFVNFNGTGTVSIRHSANVSSITDNGTGDYTVNFTSGLTSNYAWSVGANVAIGSYTGYPVLKSNSSGVPTSMSSTAFRLNTNETSNGVAKDVHYVCLTFIG